MIRIEICLGLYVPVFTETQVALPLKDPKCTRMLSARTPKRGTTLCNCRLLQGKCTPSLYGGALLGSAVQPGSTLETTRLSQALGVRPSSKCKSPSIRLQHVLRHIWTRIDTYGGRACHMCISQNNLHTNGLRKLRVIPYTSGSCGAPGLDNPNVNGKGKWRNHAWRKQTTSKAGCSG